MTQASCNCIICAQEFDSEELQSLALSEINTTNFKICKACFDACDPAEDYQQARQIVGSYLKFAQARSLYEECQGILDSRKK